MRTFIYLALTALLTPFTALAMDLGVEERMLAQLPSSLRLAHPSEHADLAAVRPTEPTPMIDNMGLSGPFLGRTDSGRLVFDAPRFHHLAYHIPSRNSRWSESLVGITHNPATGEGAVQSYGWTRTIKWDKNLQNQGEHNLAFKVNDHTYLMADQIPVAGVSVGRFDHTSGQGKALLAEPLSSHVRLTYDGPITGN